MTRFNHVCQYYSGNIKDSHPKGVITLRRLIKGIKNPPHRYISLIQRIRNQTEKAKRDQLKVQLPAFTPCAFVKGRRQYADITGFTQVAMLDFDSLPSKDYASEFKQAIFDQYECIFATWRSASGKGVRAFVRIPKVHSPDEFKAYFSAIENEFGQYKGFDSAPKNCILPLFYSIDTELLYRARPVVWTQKYEPPPPARPDVIVTYDKTSKAGWVKSNAQKAIDKIVDNGHPQLRATAFTVGGYVGGGYISQQEAINLMDTLIETNSYLSNKPRTYKTTARTMIKQGQSQPLYFNDNGQI